MKGLYYNMASNLRMNTEHACVRFCQTHGQDFIFTYLNIILKVLKVILLHLNIFILQF